MVFIKPQEEGKKEKRRRRGLARFYKKEPFSFYHLRGLPFPNGEILELIGKHSSSCREMTGEVSSFFCFVLFNGPEHAFSLVCACLCACAVCLCGCIRLRGSAKKAPSLQRGIEEVRTENRTRIASPW